MKNIRKLVTVVLTLSLTLSLAACGAENSSNGKSIRFTTEALSAPSDPTVKNEMSSVGFLRSLIEAA